MIDVEVNYDLLEAFSIAREASLPCTCARLGLCVSKGGMVWVLGDVIEHGGVELGVEIECVVEACFQF